MKENKKKNNSLKTNLISKKLKYSFKNKNYLELALTHSSYEEKNKTLNYERLEFLGDRVLGLAIAQIIYMKFPMEKEGELAKRFADLVSKKTLINISKKIGLEENIRTSKEYKKKIKITESMLSDSLEAILGAIFMDSDYETVSKIISELWDTKLSFQLFPPNNPKSLLQEWCLGKKMSMPVYTVLTKKGTDHKPTFTIELVIDSFIKVQADGLSKQEAEIKAASKVLLKINNEKK